MKLETSACSSICRPSLVVPSDSDSFCSKGSSMAWNVSKKESHNFCGARFSTVGGVTALNMIIGCY